jgi:hypothetical protein
MKNANIKTEENGKQNQSKFTLGIAGTILIGTIAFGAACGVSKSETNTTPAQKTATAVNEKPAANAPEKTAVGETAKINSAPPQALADAGEFAENVYDFAKLKDWTKANEKLTSLEKSVGELKAKDLAVPQLVEATNSLATAVKSKNEIDAMREANQATFLVAEATTKYNLTVPVEIVKLDYYGREIEVLAMTKDQAKLKLTAQAIRQTWNAVKPKIEAKGASKEAAKFESIVAQTEKAASIADYAKVATPILDEVDNLEKVFG